jgi:pimeloyl-ACP methyl ester carboxylesterase
MDIVMVSGLWLDGASWQRVLPALEQAGHRAHPLTLPGMESADADRSAVSTDEIVAAVVAAIDSAEGRVLLVGHSAGCAIATAAVDARPDRVARVMYVGGFPAADGKPVAGGFPVEGDGIPFPDWSDFGEEDLRDLDDAGRAEFKARAIPSPGRLTSDPLRLKDERRYDVPATAVCPEYTAAQLREWIDAGEEPVQEFTKLRDLTYVDLPTGHWPQFTRPDDLARVILDAAPAQG